MFAVFDSIMSDNIESKVQTNNTILDLNRQGTNLQEGAIGVGISNLGGKDNLMKDCIGINNGNVTQTEVSSNVVINTPQVNCLVYLTVFYRYYIINRKD